MKTGNPAFTMGGTVFDDWARTDGRSTTMTVQGTAAKAVGMLVVLGVCAAVAWTQVLNHELSAGLLMGSAIGGLILALATAFKPTWAPVTAPLYAAAEGFFLGAISSLINIRYPGIAMQAVAFTFGTAATMLVLYSTRMVRVTEPFIRMVVAATGALCLVYMISFLLNMFGVSFPYLHDSGPIGLLVSVVAIGLAAMNLLLDFDFIETQSNRGAPKSLEWYGAFGLMVTLVWLYIEILRLLMKLQDRR
jgi:uncharacterized YccA/Bax inhibitor family protein